jgi:hypothetical protein
MENVDRERDGVYGNGSRLCSFSGCGAEPSDSDTKAIITSSRPLSKATV